jgi:hypothetical protein
MISMESHDDIYCMFDGIGYKALHVNGTHITCIRPVCKMLGPSAVEISLNGVDTANGSVKYVYYVSPPVVTVLYPTIIPLNGGTLVTIRGSNFRSDMICKFGDQAVEANFISLTEITCKTPVQTTSGYKALSLSVNGLHFVSTGYSFDYVNEIVLMGIEPGLGPEGGGTKVYIRGSLLGERSDIRCEFGSKLFSVKGTRESQDMISCIAPHHIPGKVEVRVSINDQQSSESYLIYEYYPYMKVNRITPSEGVSSGGTKVYFFGEMIGMPLQFQLSL